MQANLLADSRVLVQLERGRDCLVENFELFAQYLYRPGSHRRVDGGVGARPHTAGHFQYILAAHPVGALKMRLGIGVENHLHDTLTVPHIQENHPAVVTAPVDPATQGDRFIDISCSQSATIMTAHNLVSVWMFWPGPQKARN